MVIAFVGHAFVFPNSRIKEIVKDQILNNIEKTDTVICYLGGYGDFDEICLAVCREIKKEYTRLQLIYVTPYFGISDQTKIKEMISLGLYDDSVYPPIENTPLKFAISKRNEWMMRNSDLIIAYVSHNYGGAYTSLKTAKRAKKKIINIADFL